MGYTDAQGRPELVMHPDIMRGAAAFRIVTEPPADLPDHDAAAVEHQAEPPPA